jgi:hypothetical protein
MIVAAWEVACGRKNVNCSTATSRYLLSRWGCGRRDSTHSGDGADTPPFGRHGDAEGWGTHVCGWDSFSGNENDGISGQLIFVSRFAHELVLYVYDQVQFGWDGLVVQSGRLEAVLANRILHRPIQRRIIRVENLYMMSHSVLVDIHLQDDLRTIWNSLRELGGQIDWSRVNDLGRDYSGGIRITLG